VVTKFLNWLNVLKQKLDSVSSRIFLWDFLYFLVYSRVLLVDSR
jgi:hypothetical protein